MWKAHLQKKASPFQTKGPVLPQVDFVHLDLKPFTFLAALHTVCSCQPLKKFFLTLHFSWTVL